MKKNKGNQKGNKLFVKREKVSYEQPEQDAVLPENVEQGRAIPEQKIDKNSTSVVVELGNRIEFEEVESPAPVVKPVNKSVSYDSGSQAIADENTILIKRTVRSGQSIQFDGNVVVLGDVNPGSEIIASGNIVVMGALRGVVHAGATGNEEATVAAFKLQPTQLRIANHITRAPDGDYITPEHPEIARIKDGVVVIELYQMGQDKQIKIC